MTDCGNCQAEIGPEGPHIRVAVDGPRVCSGLCALELMTDADVVVVEDVDCPGCGRALDDCDGRPSTPDGYQSKHCARCTREIEQRRPRRAA